MPKEYSPFTPGQPVPVDFFVGREEEINTIIRYLKQVRSGRQENIFVLGERGIGKSSLGAFVRTLAETEYSFLSVHVHLGGVSTLEEMIKRIFSGLLKISMDKPWHEKLKTFFGDRVRKVDLFGVSIELEASQQELKTITDNFVQSLRNLLDTLNDSKKAFLIILDDINGLAHNPEFANWYKSLVDEVATSQEPLPLLLMLVGLPERRDALVQCQPSLSRVFTLTDVQPLSREETEEFYRKAFSSVNISIDDEALGFLSNISGGLPMLIQEIGDAVFWIDRDDQIDVNDGLAGVLSASEIVGEKHIDRQVLNAIRSDKYRSILNKMSQDPPVRINFQKKDVESRLSSNDRKVFNNFLRRLRELGVLYSDGRGGYRFVNNLYYFYLIILLEKDSLRKFIRQIRR